MIYVLIYEDYGNTNIIAASHEPSKLEALKEEMISHNNLIKELHKEYYVECEKLQKIFIPPVATLPYKLPKPEKELRTKEEHEERAKQKRRHEELYSKQMEIIRSYIREKITEPAEKIVLEARGLGEEYKDFMHMSTHGSPELYKIWKIKEI